MRALLAAILIVAPLAGCVADPPSNDLEPASFAPEQSPTPDAAPSGAAPERVPEGSQPAPSTSSNATAPPPAPVPAPVPPPPPAFVVEHRFANVTMVGAGYDTGTEQAGQVCCVAKSTDDSNVQSFALAGGARALVVELRWADPALPTGQTYIAELDVILKAPDYADAVPPSADGSRYTGHRWASVALEQGQPARLVVDDPAVLALEGGWTVEVGAKGPANCAIQIAFTSFTGQAPAEDYSAFA